MNSPIKVGLVGFGHSARIFHTPIISSIKEYEIKAVFSSRPKEVQALLPHAKIFSNIEEILRQDIDLVVVSSPNEYHFEHAKAAISAGKHVVVEKPFATSSKEALELIRLAKEKNVLLSVFHNRRWDGGFLTVKKLIESGEVGDIRLYKARSDRFRPLPNDLTWREEAKSGSGLFWDIGSHLIDQALHLFGKPDCVTGDIGYQRPGTLVDDYFNITLRYGELRVILEGSCLVHSPTPGFEVHGTKGSFVKYGRDIQEKNLRAGLTPNDHNWGVDSPSDYGVLTSFAKGEFSERKIPTELGCYQDYYTELAKAMQSKSKKLPVTSEEALSVINIIEEVQKVQRI